MSRRAYGGEDHHTVRFAFKTELLLFSTSLQCEHYLFIWRGEFDLPVNPAWSEQS